MTIYGKGYISNYRNCSLSYVWYSVLYRMLTNKEHWSKILNIIITVLTAIVTTLGTTSCIGV